MLFARRLTALRAVTLVAVVASAILVVDTVKPGREFCPLEQACSAAAESELGSIGGIPTSMLGLGAFAFVLLATLLPVRMARMILQPVCFVGALIAMALIAYQAMYLDAFCPLCLVADVAAIVMGYLALTWPPLPILRSGRRLSAETQATRMAWGLAVILAVVGPFAWPRAEDPGWEEAPLVADALFEDAAPVDAQTAPAPAPTAEPTAEPAAPADVPARPTAPADPAVVAIAPPEPAPPEPVQPAPAPIEAAVAAPTAPTPAPATVAETPVVLPTREAIDALRAPRRPVTPPKPMPDAQPQVRIIEYLNAFCAHCRATHKRLEGVLEHSDTRIERRRVYTWKGNDYPLWARACAYAASIGREHDMFRELTRARRETAGEVFAAAQRAGIDSPAFRRAMDSTEPPPRLVRDKRIARAARLTRLPTFDIGRRRLSGSQSERELRAALQAAARSRTPADG